jgi:hypothetical protein
VPGARTACGDPGHNGRLRGRKASTTSPPSRSTRDNQPSRSGGRRLAHQIPEIRCQALRVGGYAVHYTYSEREKRWKVFVRLDRETYPDCKNPVIGMTARGIGISRSKVLSGCDLSRLANRVFLLGWARPGRAWDLPILAWVDFTQVRDRFTCARNGSRPDCGEMHHRIATGLRRKCPRSVRPGRAKALSEVASVCADARHGER